MKLNNNLWITVIITLLFTILVTLAKAFETTKYCILMSKSELLGKLTSQSKVTFGSYLHFLHLISISFPESGTGL